MRRTRLTVLLALALSLLLPVSWAAGWYTFAHHRAAQAAVQVLPAEMPRFFIAGADLIAHCSVDPDYFKNPAAPQLSKTEGPEHFLDLELLQGQPLPPTREEYLKLCQELNQTPGRVGTLPYAVTEWAQRLMLAFAEHRRWPENKAIQAKGLVYAGILAHYAGDTCQPLHCTVDYDGRVGADGKAARRGIHAQVDALLERPELDAAAAIRDLKIAPAEGFFAAVTAEIKRSHALVDRVYELEPKLPAAADRGVKLEVAPEVVAFEQERMRATAAFIATLYLTAWQKSADVRLPEWDQRDVMDRHAPPPAAPAR